MPIPIATDPGNKMCTRVSEIGEDVRSNYGSHAFTLCYYYHSKFAASYRNKGKMRGETETKRRDSDFETGRLNSRGKIKLR